MLPSIYKEKLDIYHDLLLTWQKTINLISSSTIDSAWERHFEDSLQLLDLIPQDIKNICDIGSGAGFPGLVIAICRPNIQVNLVESDVRKCAFLRTVSRETNCKNITIYNDRIENCLDEIKPDYVTARALASLEQLLSYTELLWKNDPNFQMLLPKGRNINAEITLAKQSYSFEFQLHTSKVDADSSILSVSKITTI